MKVRLDKRVVTALTIDTKPIADATGRVVGASPNAGRKPFIVHDAHQDAPVGFGLRVSRTVKSYVLVRRVGARVLSTTVGRHPDLLLGNDVPADRNARLVAAEVASRVRRGENPAETRRQLRAKEAASGTTLRRLFEDWLADYGSSAKRDPRTNTIKAVEKAMERVGDKLLEKRAEEVTWKDIASCFNRIAGQQGHVTAAEQTVRWVSAVYNKANGRQVLDAVQARSQPQLYVNPAAIFASTGALRNAAELQRDYEKKRVRRPLTEKPGQLTRWLDAVLAARRRPAARTGADYLLVTLLLGLRRSESAGLAWHDRTEKLPPGRHPKAGTNVVDLESGSLALGHTKNRWSHELPLPEFVQQVLRERRLLVGESPYVFPSACRVDRFANGYYRDPRSLLQVVRKQAGVSFAMHDLRRTIGNVATALGIPSDTVRQLLNHKGGRAGAGVRYTALSLEQLRAVVQHIEDEILAQATDPPTRRSAQWQRRAA